MLKETQPGFGVGFRNVDINVIPNADVVAGEVVQFDLSNASATDCLENSEDSCWTRVVEPILADIDWAPVCVMLGTTSSGQLGRARLQGRVDALCNNTVAVGAPLARAGFSGVGRLASPTATAGHRVVAIAQEALASAPGTVEVIIDGWSGFGNLT